MTRLGRVGSEKVEAGKVEQSDKEGNDEADDAADKGAKDEQPDLAGSCGTYAKRNEEYREAMAKIGILIVKVKKEDKIKR